MRVHIISLPLSEHLGSEVGQTDIIPLEGQSPEEAPDLVLRLGAGQELTLLSTSS